MQVPAHELFLFKIDLESAVLLFEFEVEIPNAFLQLIVRVPELLGGALKSEKRFSKSKDLLRGLIARRSRCLDLRGGPSEHFREGKSRFHISPLASAII